MQSIFNSLGSNYSLKFIITSLQSILYAPKSNLIKLEEYLAKTYDGKVLNLYKGRDAIEACCRVLLPQGSKIITQAFSCYAVEEGIVRAQMEPIYADIGKSGTNLDIASITVAFKNHPDAKAILIQHSLGISADSVGIKKWCEKQGLLLIEDVAQGIGGVDNNGTILGRNADAIIFSYGKDKIIDAVSGGSVVFRKLNAQQEERLIEVKNMVKKLPFIFVYEDLLYPGITFLIGKTHHLGLGKIVFKVSKALGLISNQIQSKTDKMTWMHPAYANLALLQFKDLEEQLQQRREIVQEYFKQFKKDSLEILIAENEIKTASNLRFSLRCKNLEQVNKLVKALKKKRIYVDDRWYRKAVDCGSFACKTAYKNGSCKNAELLAGQVLNLPTHRVMTIKKVQKICKIILENA